MILDTQFFTHSAATTWLIGIIAVLFVALVAVELWLAGPRKLRRAWRDVKDVALFGLFVVVFLVLPEDDEQ